MTSAALDSEPRGVLEARTQNLHQVLDDLRERGVQRVFVEGGPTLASAFVRSGLADRVLTYIAPVLLGGEKTAIGDIGVSTMTQARRLTLTSIERLGDDVLLIAEPARTSADERTD